MMKRSMGDRITANDERNDEQVDERANDEKKNKTRCLRFYYIPKHYWWSIFIEY